MPTVGAGSSQREDFPAHRLPAHTIQGLGNAHLYAMAWLGGYSRVGGQLSARPYSPSPTKIPMRHAVARINDATRRATSLQTPPPPPPPCHTPPPSLPRPPPPAIVPPSPYHRPTSSSAPSDFMPKSEGAAAQVGGWYGDGTAQNPPFPRCWGAALGGGLESQPFAAVAKIFPADCSGFIKV